MMSNIQLQQNQTKISLKTFEPVREISNNVTFCYVYTQTSLCILFLSLETPNGVQSEAKQS